jgi:hypothetical protein
VALNLIGEPLNPGPDLPPGGYLQLHPPITREVGKAAGASFFIPVLQQSTGIDAVIMNAVCA